MKIIKYWPPRPPIINSILKLKLLQLLVFCCTEEKRWWAITYHIELSLQQQVGDRTLCQPSHPTDHELSITNTGIVRFPTFNFYTYANWQKLASYNTPAEAQSLPNLQDEETVVVAVQGLRGLTELAHNFVFLFTCRWFGTSSIGTNKYTFKTDWFITCYLAIKEGHTKYHSSVEEIYKIMESLCDRVMNTLSTSNTCCKK